MVLKVENLTAKGIGVALDTAIQRHQVIATNIANVNTVGYIPKQLSFSSQMSQMQSLFDTARKGESPSFSELNLVVMPVLDSEGLPAKVELDTEVAAMAQNSLHYQSLVKALGRHYSILASAVSDGKK